MGLLMLFFAVEHGTSRICWGSEDSSAALPGSDAEDHSQCSTKSKTRMHAAVIDLW